jgi:hypothetical protein
MNEPDVAPEDREQAGNPPQFSPPHVMSATAVAGAVPGGHVLKIACTQLDSFVLPSVAEDLPPVQSRQTLTPSADEYLPATQSKQLLAPGAAEYLPAPQSMHAVSEGAPIAVEYLPAVQSVHAPPTLHAAENPPFLNAGPDVKITWRKPVEDV